ncbi:hypothetical protein RHMOL_Rhmol10G0235100 [Rhododendron molle]|uniref:Uncharacterized protein n=1 Tax=Rhododendron molle TaxID=49168 RepID=A0ACC0M6F8_RHOML|nr:hypothetical protein RHMOL_Rhmol10G0235100 [Rhododendron molle]
MAGDLVNSFPDLLRSNPPRIRGSDLSISRVSPKIDIISMLDKATIPTFEHLKVDASDGPAAKQIKELNAEVLKLNKILEEKEKLLVSKTVPGMPPSSTEFLAEMALIFQSNWRNTHLRKRIVKIAHRALSKGVIPVRCHVATVWLPRRIAPFEKEL